MKDKIIIVAAIALFTIKGHAAPMLETLYGDFYNQSGVNIQVFSGGCTSKKSFSILKKHYNGVELIYFYRVKPDLCRAFYKYGEILNFSNEDLGLQYNDRFKVMNPHVTSRVVL